MKKLLILVSLFLSSSIFAMSQPGTSAGASSFEASAHEGVSAGVLTQADANADELTVNYKIKCNDGGITGVELNKCFIDIKKLSEVFFGLTIKDEDIFVPCRREILKLLFDLIKVNGDGTYMLDAKNVRELDILDNEFVIELINLWNYLNIPMLKNVIHDLLSSRLITFYEADFTSLDHDVYENFLSDVYKNNLPRIWKCFPLQITSDEPKDFTPVVAFSKDGNFYVQYHALRRNINKIDLASRKEVAIYKVAPLYTVQDFYLSNNGKYLLCLLHQIGHKQIKKLILIDLEKPESFELAYDISMEDFVVDNDGQVFIKTNNNTLDVVFQNNAQVCKKTLITFNSDFSFAFSQDYKKLVVGTCSSVLLYELKDNVINQLTAYNFANNTGAIKVAISPDGSRIVWEAGQGFSTTIFADCYGRGVSAIAGSNFKSTYLGLHCDGKKIVIKRSDRIYVLDFILAFNESAINLDNATSFNVGSTLAIDDLTGIMYLYIEREKLISAVDMNSLEVLFRLNTGDIDASCLYAAYDKIAWLDLIEHKFQLCEMKLDLGNDNLKTVDEIVSSDCFYKFHQVFKSNDRDEFYKIFKVKQ